MLAAKGYTALFGHYLLVGREMDETVGAVLPGSHSYTGEDVIELSVHGAAPWRTGCSRR